MKTLKKLYAQLTPARRKVIYKIAGVIGAAIVAKGIASADDVRAVLEVLGLALGVVGVPALAAANISK